MEQIKYYSIIPNSKPDWLLMLTYETTIYLEGVTVEDNDSFWVNFKKAIDKEIKELYNENKIISVVCSKIVTDECKTVIHINRNNRTVQIFYINNYGKENNNDRRRTEAV